MEDEHIIAVTFQVLRT